MAASRLPALILGGFGTPNSLQISVETQQAIVQAGRAFSIGLPARLESALKRQGVQVVPLDANLADRPPAEGYASVAVVVLTAAEQDPPAIFLSQGNPLFLNSINRYLFSEADARGLAIRIFPGISPVDLVINELGLDVGRAGLLTIAASGVIRKPAALSPKVPLLLLGVGALDASGRDELTGALSWRYPAGQPVTLLNVSPTGGITRATVTLERFADLTPHIDTSSMLFLDAALPLPGLGATTKQGTVPV